jgi:hypothetical protein
MTWEEIMNLKDISEKNKELINFYKNDILVEDWLSENLTSQKIRFKDRIEFKLDGKYHNLTGTAIQYNKGGGEYYINGEMLSYDIWKEKSTKLLREKKLKRTLENN